MRTVKSAKKIAVPVGFHAATLQRTGVLLTGTSRGKSPPSGVSDSDMSSEDTTDYPNEEGACVVCGKSAGDNGGFTIINHRGNTIRLCCYATVV